MNNNILNTVIQDFINNNISIDVTTLLFKNYSFEGTTIKEIVEQIESKKRCKTKLPTWFNTPKIYYPNKLNIEQTSSELTAAYKSKIISGNSLIDLTGGLGVDCYYFSKSFQEGVHCELNTNLSEIAKHNFNILATENINCVNIDGLVYLKSLSKTFDWIYIDPSRRNDTKGKVFYLKDCIPNVPANLDALFKYTDQLLIKTSPMLDLKVGINELQHVYEIHVVAVNNEVKEVLYLLHKNSHEQIEVKTINLTASSKEQCFNFKLEDEQHTTAAIGEVSNYLYVPNAAILKAGAFKIVSAHFNVNKLHQNSHLYTSKTLVDFPGRSFKVLKIIPYQKRDLKPLLEKRQLNVATRNFPDTVAQLKKKFKFKDGGNDYVFFTTTSNNDKVVIFCEKL